MNKFIPDHLGNRFEWMRTGNHLHLHLTRSACHQKHFTKTKSKQGHRRDPASCSALNRSGLVFRPFRLGRQRPFLCFFAGPSLDFLHLFFYFFFTEKMSKPHTWNFIITPSTLFKFGSYICIKRHLAPLPPCPRLWNSMAQKEKKTQGWVQRGL